MNIDYLDNAVPVNVIEPIAELDRRRHLADRAAANATLLASSAQARLGIIRRICARHAAGEITSEQAVADITAVAAKPQPRNTPEGNSRP